MKLIEKNNHYLVKLETNVGDYSLFLVDTGNPYSFSFCSGITSVVINGISYPLNLRTSPSVNEMVAKLTGESVDGFVGRDVLEKTGLTVSKMNCTIDFATTDGNTIANLMRHVGQYPTTGDFVINGNQISHAFFDTGAYISYVSKKYLSPKNKLSETYVDYNPSLGKISGNFYQVELSSRLNPRYGHSMKVAELPAQLESIGIEAFLGVNAIIENEKELAPSQTISADYKNGCIMIS